jgi:hypothetical protein
MSSGRRRHNAYGPLTYAKLLLTPPACFDRHEALDSFALQSKLENSGYAASGFNAPIFTRHVDSNVGVQIVRPKWNAESTVTGQG